jgi:hypothetical protein
MKIIKLNEKLIDYETPYYFVVRVSRDIITDLKTGFTSLDAYPSLRKLNEGLACWHLKSYVVGDAIFEYCKRLETHNLIERMFYPNEVLRIIDLSPLDGVLYKCDLKDTYLIEVKDTHFDPAM